jgi:uncharacterized protein YlaI
VRKERTTYATYAWNTDAEYRTTKGFNDPKATKYDYATRTWVVPDTSKLESAKSLPANSLHPSTWNPWYTESNSPISTYLCDICEADTGTRKFNDVYLCEDCAERFKSDIAELDADFEVPLTVADDGVVVEWDECQFCGSCVDVNDLMWAFDFGDWQLLCQRCVRLCNCNIVEPYAAVS